ncbi:hypothetical protein MHBO_004007 [Bonamia ostreae]|uniref:C2H2-type domain-containing protein n=1 Tax=Bonamia ostreae TaxID=126728 RepID=A0ABV2AS38_9EUKA
MGGNFGTEEEPVLIPSRMDHRIVGCTGYGERNHDLGYFLLRAGPIHRCPECGQCFALDTAHPGHPDHPDHKYYEEEKEVWDLQR